jgi:hypothetical protein
MFYLTFITCPVVYKNASKLLLKCFLTNIYHVTSAHRNEHLMGLLRTFSPELKGKEPAGERKRKKSSKKDERVIDIDDDGM